MRRFTRPTASIASTASTYSSVSYTKTHAGTLAATFTAALLLTACGPKDGTAGEGQLQVVRDTVGDTLVVRTVSGSVWGAEAYLQAEMSIGELDGDLEYLLGRVVSLGVGADGTVYLVDRQVPELRAYNSGGSYIGTLGGPGEGPGELKSPDGGLAVLTDGRVLVRDPGNARLQEFTAAGEPGESWTVVRGGFNTSQPLWWDREDNVYVSILLDPQADVREWRTGLVRIRPDGTPADTLDPPDAGYEAPAIEARMEDGDNVSVSRNSVPFSPDEEWAFHPGGYFVHGVSTSYAVTLNQPDGLLRIEREYDPVRVKAAEEEDNPDYDPREDGSRPTRWREPIAFDVFGEDGTYFGRVHTPDGFSPYPTPVIDGDYVWAVTRDELGVQRVVRFRVQVGEVGTEG